ncbi:unnamed protein product [Triticum turgidum subsp. durum]|uniref:Cytochrome c oxidase subunit Vb n=1 Tax=Triticum turgidum subsp. durum TaxID=4567 RepID=A0A9R0VLF8_TRITD|nr:unnamed protein product [Triticum turgidum subsp. durum]
MRPEVPVRSGAATDVGEHGRGGSGSVSGGCRGGDDEPGGGVDYREELLVQQPAREPEIYVPGVSHAGRTEFLSCSFHCIVMVVMEAPAVIESYFDKRIVGCPGDEGEDEHDVIWFWLKKDEPHECPVCSQYFVLKVIGDGGNPDGHDDDDDGHHH